MARRRLTKAEKTLIIGKLGVKKGGLTEKTIRIFVAGILLPLVSPEIVIVSILKEIGKIRGEKNIFKIKRAILKGARMGIRLTKKAFVEALKLKQIKKRAMMRAMRRKKLKRGR